MWLSNQKSNKLEFKIAKINSFGNNHYVTHIYIDGKDLRKIVKEVELPFARKKGRPKLAGDYEGVDAEHYYGWQNLGEIPNKKAHILSCTCLEPGCYPLVVDIGQDGKNIIWTNFASNQKWDYTSLEFTFEKNDYLKKVASLEKQLEQKITDTRYTI